MDSGEVNNFAFVGWRILLFIMSVCVEGRWRNVVPYVDPT